MSSVPPGVSSLRLPFGNIVHYSTGRPSIRGLVRDIAALGYEVSFFPLEHPDLRSLTPGVWHNSVIVGDFIICIVSPTVPSIFSDSTSAQSGYISSQGAPDSEHLDPDYFDNLLIYSDQNGYLSSQDDQSSDNLGLDYFDNLLSDAQTAQSSANSASDQDG